MLNWTTILLAFCLIYSVKICNSKPTDDDSEFQSTSMRTNNVLQPTTTFSETTDTEETPMPFEEDPTPTVMPNESSTNATEKVVTTSESSIKDKADVEEAKIVASKPLLEDDKSGITNDTDDEEIKDQSENLFEKVMKFAKAQNITPTKVVNSFKKVSDNLDMLLKVVVSQMEDTKGKRIDPFASDEKQQKWPNVFEEIVKGHDKKNKYPKKYQSDKYHHPADKYHPSDYYHRETDLDFSNEDFIDK